MATAKQLQDLYFRLEKVETHARCKLREYDLAKRIDEVMSEVHDRYMKVRGW